jgi:hypothetical protein
MFSLNFNLKYWMIVHHFLALHDSYTYEMKLCKDMWSYTEERRLYCRNIQTTAMKLDCILLMVITGVKKILVSFILYSPDIFTEENPCLQMS